MGHNGGMMPPRHMIHRLLPFYQPPDHFRFPSEHSSNVNHNNNHLTPAASASNGNSFVVDFRGNKNNGEKDYLMSLNEPRIVYYGDNVEYKKPADGDPMSGQPSFSFVTEDESQQKFQRRKSNGVIETCICKEAKEEIDGDRPGSDRITAMATGYVPILSPSNGKKESTFDHLSSSSKPKNVHEQMIPDRQPLSADMNQPWTKQSNEIEPFKQLETMTAHVSDNSPTKTNTKHLASDNNNAKTIPTTKGIVLENTSTEDDVRQLPLRGRNNDRSRLFNQNSKVRKTYHLTGLVFGKLAS